MQSYEEPPQGCHHFSSTEELDYDLHKYFHQRHSIFSRYDDGIWMTEDAWYGVTPEPVAKLETNDTSLRELCSLSRSQIAAHLSLALPENVILVDAFAGVGGNVIAFALTGRFQQIYAIEKDPAVLACAKHNAAIYGVEDVITWVEGDCFSVLVDQLYGEQTDIAIFASPPWGGPSYCSDTVFDLSQMQPYNLDKMMRAFTKISADIALYLPRTSDVRQLAAWQKTSKRLLVTHYCVKGASKALCAYFGKLCRENPYIMNA